MLLQLTGFIFDCTCIILPTPIVHIDNYCYLYYSTLFSPFTALYFILHLSYTLKKGHFENKPFIHSFIHSMKSVVICWLHTTYAIISNEKRLTAFFLARLNIFLFSYIIRYFTKLKRTMCYIKVHR